MKKLPIGIQTYKTIIDENYLYVDKTKDIYNLITTNKYYFLSRPRRFGKSLLISTLKELFLGNKEIFKNQYIYNTDYNWQEHPIIHFDFSMIANQNPENLTIDIIWQLELTSKEYGIDISKAPSMQAKFKYLITELSKVNNVVVLIDEYDYAILSHLDNTKIAKANRNILRDFYGVLKGMEAYLKFVMLTGVTKFTKISLFSGLNNLKDISYDQDYSTITGYTQDELEKYFDEYIIANTKKQKIDKTKLLKEIKLWYNGYRFSIKDSLVYNPFSILLYLDCGRFSNYWYNTGSPSFLHNLLQYRFKTLENINVGKAFVIDLGSFDIENTPLITILFQTGYLTIKDYTATRYKLGFPNLEVKLSFERNLLSVYTFSDNVFVDNNLAQLSIALQDKNLEEFFQLLRLLFANIPYHLHLGEEKYYHSIFQFMGTLLDLDVQSEVSTDVGRIDLVIYIKNYIYIFEFKFNSTPDKALKQIEKLKYYQKYVPSKKHIILVGVAFNRSPRKFNIEYCAKELD